MDTQHVVVGVADLYIFRGIKPDCNLQHEAFQGEKVLLNHIKLSILTHHLLYILKKLQVMN